MEDSELTHLEAQLAALPPPAVPARLRDALARQLAEEPLTLGDRVLAFVGGCGALAAGVILTITLWQLTTAAPPPDTQTVASRQQSIAEYQILLAAR